MPHAKLKDFQKVAVEVILNPIVTVTDQAIVDVANELYKKANERCFIANSVNFPVFQWPIAKTN